MEALLVTYEQKILGHPLPIGSSTCSAFRGLSSRSPHTRDVQMQQQRMCEIVARFKRSRGRDHVEKVVRRMRTTR